jgi:hypothetical protein
MNDRIKNMLKLLWVKSLAGSFIWMIVSMIYFMKFSQPTWENTIIIFAPILCVYFGVLALIGIYIIFFVWELPSVKDKS